jgi:hypothetical protein
MSNDLRAQTDEGLKKLSQDQGKNGLPPAPDVSQIPNPNGQGTPDPDAVNQLNQQRQDADQTEKEIGGGPGGGNVMLMPIPIFPTQKPDGHPSGEFALLEPTIDTRPDMHLKGVRLIPDLTPGRTGFPGPNIGFGAALIRSVSRTF